ncbi:MAG: carbonic anhydrase [Verrucomicrobiota bacterium]
MPIIALTCIDPRLNALFPNVLGIPGDQFIWMRNAGNIVTGPLSSTMRSLALACAVKGGQEIAIIGHTDCQVAKTPTVVLLDRLQALGVDRSRLPDNINEYFGTFGSERQNVIKACDFVRSSPLIGPKIPVHGLMLDIGTGKLDWVVNGYDTLQSSAQPTMPKMDFAALGTTGSFKSLHFFMECGIPPWRELKKTTGIIGTPVLEIHTKFMRTATYGEPLQVHTSIESWAAKTFVQKHVVMRGDTVLCEGRETRTFVVHPEGEPDRIKAIPVPDDIKSTCS